MENILLRQTIYSDGSKKWMMAIKNNGTMSEIRITKKQYLELKKAGLAYSETDFSKS